MALQHLNDEQIATWTRAQKDEWWFKNVFRGDMAQLTLRSGLTGFLLGGVLSATGLYIGAKTGLSLGVGLTSVILAFALFRALHSAGLAKDYTILENNCTQSIATASGYVTSSLIASLPAYMLVTGVIPPWWQMMVWILVISLIGVLIAFPLKRRFINEDQAPFPEGRACGVVLDSLYDGNGDEGVFKAKLLGWVSGAAALYQGIVSDGWMKLLQFKVLMLDKWAGLKEPRYLHDRLDDYYYAWATKAQGFIPNILGTDFRTLGLRLTLDVAVVGVGGLMGLAIAASCFLGAFINFVVLAPLMIQMGDIAPRLGANGLPVPLSRVEIVNQWSLWWGVTMMVVGAMVSLLAKPEIFTGLFKKRAPKVADDGVDILRHIEVPLWISYIGVPALGLLGAFVTHLFFGVPLWMAVVSLPLIFVLSIICTNSMALTSWTPTGALSKITQFTMGALDRSNPAANLLPAGMTAEISSNAANLLSDIKPGYMLGGKPRHQAIGHVIGNIAGVLVCVPLFFLLFLHPDASGVRSTAGIVSDQFGFPAALQWKGVADIISKGLKSLPASVLISMAVAAFAAVAMEVARIKTKGRFQLSAVATGLGVVLPPESTFMMFVGALLFWLMGLRHGKKPGSFGHRVWVEGMEPICAGLISGAALMGIGNAIINVLI
ncbi:OPT family oligopeptide transporter [Roseateles saccharophilus]|uniref:Putative oligopeptide transporter (OPT) family protein n=1 Tax=Roseateles saccharophilus TaxID=304 RepID=A0A4V2VPM6_ROSSA|nr:OPT family oligopeptide transporter [Roseateles saccharophilus]MDG0834169.1 OPT family oligopeptide transporter [Roseateles saccharophilus]TCU91309.1 putative oligopeptide transporter (OPT) family protein [Roseateles saccharophilus]